jgi:hypothetical protein
MRMSLRDLDPSLLKRASRLRYEHTDDVGEADCLQLQCPACHWADRRIGGDNVSHTILLWRDPQSWGFVGHDCNDLSVMAGSLAVTLTGGCGARFYIRNGKVDFY